MIVQALGRPVFFLDLDDVLVISAEFTSYQVHMAFKLNLVDEWPELWQGLVFKEGARNLRVLDEEFHPQYVMSTSWTHKLSRGRMEDVLRRASLAFVADNLHPVWTTPKGAPGTARVTEIEGWTRAYAQPGQVLLALDDDESGWSLADSQMDKQHQVVLCETGVGFVANKLAEAQQKVRAQLRSGA